MCINDRMYICCSECNIVSKECNEPTPYLVQHIGEHGGVCMYFGSFCLKGELGFLKWDDICMCVVNKQFEHLEFVFDSVYVDPLYDDIFLTFPVRSVSLCGVCSHVVVFGLWGCLGTICGCGGCCDCDVCTVSCVACVYVERVRWCDGDCNAGIRVGVCGCGTRGSGFVSTAEIQDRYECGAWGERCKWSI